MHGDPDGELYLHPCSWSKVLSANVLPMILLRLRIPLSKRNYNVKDYATASIH